MLTSFHIALLATILAIIGLWQIHTLRTHLHIEDQISKRKWRRAVKGPRFNVMSMADVYPTGTNPSQANFFKATENIVMLLNTWYNETPWSFEDEGRLELEPLSGAERRIVIRHGQQKTGSLRVSAIDFDSGSSYIKGSSTAELEIINARFWAFYDVYGIAVSVAGIIADEGKFEEAKQQAALASMDCMWRIGPDTFGNPDFEFSVRGNGLAKSSRH